MQTEYSEQELERALAQVRAFAPSESMASPGFLDAVVRLQALANRQGERLEEAERLAIGMWLDGVAERRER